MGSIVSLFQLKIPRLTLPLWSCGNSLSGQWGGELLLPQRSIERAESHGIYVEQAA